MALEAHEDQQKILNERSDKTSAFSSESLTLEGSSFRNSASCGFKDDFTNEKTATGDESSRAVQSILDDFEIVAQETNNLSETSLVAYGSLFEGSIQNENSKDGSIRMVARDGSSISTGTDGQIFETVDKHKIKTLYGHDKNGELNRVEYHNGSIWQTEDGQLWVQVQRAKNLRAPGETEAPYPREGFLGTINVDRAGTHSWNSRDGAQNFVGKLDGTSKLVKEGQLKKTTGSDGSECTFEYDEVGKPREYTVTDKSGAAVTYDHQGRVTRTVDILGQVSTFSYFESGELKDQLKLVNFRGIDWSTEDGETWTSSGALTVKEKAWVSLKGEYCYMRAGTIWKHQLDTNVKMLNSDGSHVVQDKSQNTIQTKDINENITDFGFNSKNELTQFTTDNKTWTRGRFDGENHLWTCNSTGEARWYHNVFNKSNGTLFMQSCNGDRTYKRLDGSKEVVSYAETKAATRALLDASKWSFREGGTDEEAFYGALENKSVAERKYMQEMLNIRSLARGEFEGAELERALALLNKGEGADCAGTIRVALAELDQVFHGKSDSTNERIIRNTISTMSAKEIDTSNRDYQRRYGKGMIEAILDDPNVSSKTKQAVALLKTGQDKRNSTQSFQLAQLGIKYKDPGIFQEAMSTASESTRKHYRTGEGANQLRNAFKGDWLHAFSFGLSGEVTDTTLRHVQDYAKYGELSVATQAIDNTSWLGDNEKAIIHAINSMSEQNRQRYRIGKALEEGGYLNETDRNARRSYSTYERQDCRDYYNHTKATLEKSAGKWFSEDSQENELAKWEDNITTRGGTLVSRLADHRGLIRDDTMHDIMSDIEAMNEDDWLRLKGQSSGDYEYQDSIESVLSTYLSDADKEKAIDLVRQKRRTETFEQSQQVRRPILQVLEDNGGFNVKEDKIYISLQYMTETEIAKYKAYDGDNEFRRNVDRQLSKYLDGKEYQVTRSMMDRVLQGVDEHPTLTILEKLRVHALQINGDEGRIVKEIQESFANDPELRNRVNAPRNAEERRYSNEFKTAAREAVGVNDYARYIDPIIKTGELPISRAMELHRGVFGDDEAGSYSVMKGVSRKEQTRLITDESFRQRVLGHLSADEQEVAMYTMTQGKMKPEDKIRSFVIGAGTEEQEIKQLFAELRDRKTPQYKGLNDKEISASIGIKLREVRQQYASKYGEDLGVRLINELGGQDLSEVKRQIHQRTNLEEYLFAQEQAAQSRSGMGSALTDAWEGTGPQVDNDLNALRRALSLTPDEVFDYAERLYQSIDRHADSKDGFANAIVDSTIAAVAVGGANFTGGVSLSLLSYTSLFVAGASLKVGARKFMLGEDYDFATSGFTDLLGGGFEGATVFMGLELLNVVRSAALQAAEKTLETAGERLVREGAETAFKQDLAALVAQAVKNKTPGIADDTIAQLAQKYAAEGAEESLKATLKTNLKDSVKDTGRQWLAEFVNNSIDGIVGGGGAGLITSIGTSNNAGEFAADTLSSAFFGGWGGGTMSLATKGLGQSWNGAKKILRRVDDNSGKSVGDFSSELKGSDLTGSVGNAEGTHGNAETDLPASISDATANSTGQTGESPLLLSATIDPVDGRPVDSGFREFVKGKFQPLEDSHMERAVSHVESELRQIRAIGCDGKTTSAYESLMNEPTLSDSQKADILENLGEVREHFSSYRMGAQMHPDPEVNWIHTQGEFAKVLEVGRRSGLSGDELQDALLASMYSDSIKFAFPPPTGAVPNFFTHHLDGALAAHEVLSRRGYPPERIKRIVQAINEHQMSPPQFMGMLYLNIKIKPGLDAQLKSGAITPQRHAELARTLQDMTEIGKDGVERLRPIAKPGEWPKVKREGGGWELLLSSDQKELLQLAGVNYWSVPVDPRINSNFNNLSGPEQSRLLSEFRISQTLIDGDAIDNYATLGGASKIVTIRGPRTNFKDGNVWQSIASIDNSYHDAYNVLSDTGRTVADTSIAARNQILDDAETGIYAQMDEWLRQRGFDPRDVVYFQKDGKLKYPENLTIEEAARLRELETLKTTSSPLDAKALDLEAQSLIHKGMGEEEIRQFELASEVRAKMAELLRRCHTTDGSLPGTFPSSRVEANNRIMSGGTSVATAHQGQQRLEPVSANLRGHTSSYHVVTADDLFKPIYVKPSVEGVQHQLPFNSSEWIIASGYDCGGDIVSPSWLVGIDASHLSPNQTLVHSTALPPGDDRLPQSPFFVQQGSSGGAEDIAMQRPVKADPYGRSAAEERFQQVFKNEKDLDSPRAKRALDQLLTEAERTGMFAAIGLPRSAFDIKLTKTDQFSACYRPYGNRIEVNPFSHGNPLQSLRHELQHAARAFDRAALSIADGDAYKKRTLDSVLMDVGNGEKIRIFDVNSRRWTTTRRASLSPEGRELMRDAVRNAVERNLTPQQAIAHERFAPLFDEKAFRNANATESHKKVIEELDQEMAHYTECGRQFKCELDLFGPNKAALKDLLDRRVAHYRQLQEQSGESLYNHPELIKLTRGLSGDVTGIADKGTYYRSSPDEMSARRAEWAQGLKAISELVEQAGISDPISRRDLIKKLGRTLINKIHRENTKEQLFRSQLGKPAEGQFIVVGRAFRALIDFFRD